MYERGFSMHIEYDRTAVWSVLMLNIEPQRRRLYNLFLIQEGMNTNLDTKEAQIREQKIYNTQLFLWWGARGVDFTVFKLISELIDQGLEGLLIKREGWLNGWTGVISPPPHLSSWVDVDKWLIISPNGLASSEHNGIIAAHIVDWRHIKIVIVSADKVAKLLHNRQEQQIRYKVAEFLLDRSLWWESRKKKTQIE